MNIPVHIISVFEKAVLPHTASGLIGSGRTCCNTFSGHTSTYNTFSCNTFSCNTFSCNTSCCNTSSYNTFSCAAAHTSLVLVVFVDLRSRPGLCRVVTFNLFSHSCLLHHRIMSTGEQSRVIMRCTTGNGTTSLHNLYITINVF